MTPLIESVREVATIAATAASGTAVESDISDLLTSLDEPLRVAVAGRVNAGKSTLLNALVGHELAATDAGECTRIVTWYRHGLTYRVEASMTNGSRAPVPFTRDDGALRLRLGGIDPASVEALEVEWPSRRLSELTLVDTPGIGALMSDASERAGDFLAGEQRATAVDAIVYLTRHLHRDDVAFLEGFHDREVSQPVPVTTVGVLSRADEIGVARLDAMESAATIAARYSADPSVRRLCQTVLPVAGLLAQAGATLREDEFRAFSRIAALDDASRVELLRTVDRFRQEAGAVEPPAAERAYLLERFGLYGVRLAVELIRERRVGSSSELADRLVDLSGISQLRAVLTSQFARRRDALKARSALRRLERIAPLLPDPASTQVAHAVERITDRAHELVELRLVNSLRTGAIQLDDPERAERLLGAVGPATTDRLGLPAEADREQIFEGLGENLDHYRALAEHPLSSPVEREAARLLIRTCEGIAAEIGPDRMH